MNSVTALMTSQHRESPKKQAAPYMLDHGREDHNPEFQIVRHDKLGCEAWHIPPLGVQPSARMILVPSVAGSGREIGLGRNLARSATMGQHDPCHFSVSTQYT
jgi:hypothetical protein